jgi:hypothetical protein
MKSQFVFIPYKDHTGDDLCLDKKSLEEMMTRAISQSNCCGFNTLGYFKKDININTLKGLPNFGKTDGIYVKKNFADNYFDYFEDYENLKTVCFIHSCTLAHSGIATLLGLLERIKISGLLEQLDQIFIINIGLNIDNKFPKTKIINYSDNAQLWELPTINLIYTFSQHNTNTKLLYLHTKGITHLPYNTNIQKNRAINDWINLMLYCCVDNYDKCLKLLDKYDTVGCEYMKNPVDHYSGNFWWANTRYIKELNPIVTIDRFDAEFWILSKLDVNYFNIISTNLDHFCHPIPIEIFKEKMIWN